MMRRGVYAWAITTMFACSAAASVAMGEPVVGWRPLPTFLDGTFYVKTTNKNGTIKKEFYRDKEGKEKLPVNAEVRIRTDGFEMVQHYDDKTSILRMTIIGDRFSLDAASVGAYGEYFSYKANGKLDGGGFRGSGIREMFFYDKGGFSSWKATTEQGSLLGVGNLIDIFKGDAGGGIAGDFGLPLAADTPTTTDNSSVDHNDVPSRSNTSDQTDDSDSDDDEGDGSDGADDEPDDPAFSSDEHPAIDSDATEGVPLLMDRIARMAILMRGIHHDLEPGTPRADTPEQAAEEKLRAARETARGDKRLSELMRELVGLDDAGKRGLAALRAILPHETRVHILLKPQFSDPPISYYDDAPVPFLPAESPTSTDPSVDDPDGGSEDGPATDGAEGGEGVGPTLDSGLKRMMNRRILRLDTRMVE